MIFQVVHFQSMTFASRTGTFANVTIPPVSGLNFTVSYIGTKITFNATALPAEMVDFRAKKVDTSVQLEWATASELDADRFELEHSTDVLRFAKIGERPGRAQHKQSNATVFCMKTLRRA